MSKKPTDYPPSVADYEILKNHSQALEQLEDIINNSVLNLYINENDSHCVRRVKDALQKLKNDKFNN